MSKRSRTSPTGPPRPMGSASAPRRPPTSSRCAPTMAAGRSARSRRSRRRPPRARIVGADAADVLAAADAVAQGRMPVRDPSADRFVCAHERQRRGIDRKPHDVSRSSRRRSPSAPTDRRFLLVAGFSTARRDASETSSRPERSLARYGGLGRPRDEVCGPGDLVGCAAVGLLVGTAPFVASMSRIDCGEGGVLVGWGGWSSRQTRRAR
jgi:hypothetical protein